MNLKPIHSPSFYPRHLIVFTLICLSSLSLHVEALSAAKDEVGTDWTETAGINRSEIEKALKNVSSAGKPHLLWLLQHMPAEDLQNLDASFLLEHVEGAIVAWKSAPWSEKVPEKVFRDSLLPYASINERRDRWREDFRNRFLPLIEKASSPSEAAAILNNKIFGILKVKYSTKRPKADQSPYESIEAGLASCTGLSVILIDACRSVGIPARFVGTPLWSDSSGNHSWVEVWDEGWHFTGAAEPTGEELNKGWFLGRASRASSSNPATAIYAVQWSNDKLYFPMVWKPEDTSVGAVDITHRYSKDQPTLTENESYLKISVLDHRGQRVQSSVTAYTSTGEKLKGESKDDSHDSNDLLTFKVKKNATTLVSCEKGPLAAATLVTPSTSDYVLQLQLSEPGKATESNHALMCMDLIISQYPERLTQVAQLPLAKVPLTREDAERAKTSLWKAYSSNIQKERQDEMENKTISIGKLEMPFDFKVFGEDSKERRSLWISLHGGGGAPASVNDQQWENQKRLYSPEEGIYLAPRAPTNTWNLWHQGHIDTAFDRLIENMIHFHNVDPNKVYLLGYSAGGDGVYQLAPRMADRWAAAAMMAGHPNDARPDSLLNLPFTIHMGGKDSSYNRNSKAEEWKILLEKLRSEDPAGYDHWVKIYPNKGHWMDREDAQAIPWMAKNIRNLRPEKIVWLQDDVKHDRSYWLSVDQPVSRSRIVANLNKNTVSLDTSKDVSVITVRLDDSMLDLDHPVQIILNSTTNMTFNPVRSIGTLVKTLSERGDDIGMFCTEIEISHTD